MSLFLYVFHKRIANTSYNKEVIVCTKYLILTTSIMDL